MGSAYAGRLSSATKFKTLGGQMKNSIVLDDEAFIYTDLYHGGSRLNISAHGEMFGNGSE